MDRIDELTLTFFELTVDLMCVAGTDGYLRKVNHRWTEVLGYTEGELCSRPMTEFVHVDDVQATIDIRNKFNKGEHIVGFENRYRCRDGSYRKFEWTAKREGDFVIGVARDITARIQTARMAALGEMVAEAGHAINNPLMIANFQIERIFERLKVEKHLDSKYQHFYQSYQNSSARIANAVSRLREFSDVEKFIEPVARAQVRRILIVEDEIVLAELLKEVLESDSVEVALTVNGFDAIKELGKHRFDVILTDATMPAMHAKVLIKHIYDNKLVDETCRIIIMTGSVHTVFSEEEAKLDWFKDCELVAKPISAAALKERLSLKA